MIFMDSSYLDKLNIYMAACLTFGYESQILSEKLINEKLSSINKIYKAITNYKNDKETKEEYSMLSCCPQELSEFEEDINNLETQNNLKNSIWELKRKLLVIQKNGKSVFDNFEEEQAKNICNFVSYSSLLHSCGFSDFSNMIFGKEFSILKTGKNNAIVGIRNIELSSITGDNIKMSYLKKLFDKVSRENICDYGLQFLKMNGFTSANIKSLNIEYGRIKKLILNRENIKKPSMDDNDIKINKNKKNLKTILKKNFSEAVLKEVDVKKILACDRICVQNMADTHRKLKPLTTEEMEELRRLCRLYTGNKYVILNGLLRKKIIPLYENSKLEDVIKAYEKKLNKTGGAIKIYESYDNSSNFVIPLDIYEKIKDDCHALIKAISNKGERGIFWRLMDTAGLKSMAQNKDKFKYIVPDETLKKMIASNYNDKNFFENLSKNWANEQIMEPAFLSTSKSTGVEFTYGLGRKAIVLKISSETNELNGFLVEEDFSDYDEKEFLIPPNTKFKIVSVTKYDGNKNKSEIERACIQINCIKA